MKFNVLFFNLATGEERFKLSNPDGLPRRLTLLVLPPVGDCPVWTDRIPNEHLPITKDGSSVALSIPEAAAIPGHRVNCKYEGADGQTSTVHLGFIAKSVISDAGKQTLKAGI